MKIRLLVPMTHLRVFLVLVTLTALVFAPRVHAATLTVSDCSAPMGAPGRLVDVITAAAAGDTVVFSCSGTITLAATITIDKNLTIDGAGQSVTISGGNTVRVFVVTTGVTFRLENLTVANGAGNGATGGGVHNSGALTVTNVIFSGNSASNGGGIFNSDAGTLDVTNTIFSGNSATSHGGGISIWNGSTVNVTNSTFSGNSATVGGGSIHNNGGATVNMKNSIVANAPANRNCSGTITDGGGNLQFGGAAANSCGATIPTADPRLRALANNGGPTQTMALGAGSAALDAADYATCMASVGSPNYGAGGLDQRGQSRSSVNSVCDIGAFEQQAGDITLTVSDCSAPGGATGRLVDIVSGAAHGDTVSFSCSGTITLAATITIDKNLTIDGAGQSVTISGGNAARVFMINSGAIVNLANLTVANGLASGSHGGGVYNSGALTVTNVTFSGNTASGIGNYGGGGIYNSSTGTLDVSDSTFSGNSADVGGAIHNDGGVGLDVTNSTFSGNSATLGGGALFSANTGMVTVTNSTFSGNFATSNGGGIVSAGTGTLNVTNSIFSGNWTTSIGGGIHNYNSTLSVTNSTFSGNAATSNGGGIFSAGGLNVTNSAFSDNGAGAGGGGIYGTGTSAATNSTFSNNSATYGGGIVNSGGSTLKVTNSTFSGNSAFNGGGGIHNDGTLNVTNSTFSGNSAPGLTGDGGGIYNSAGTVTVTNSTFSGNSAGADVGDAGGIRGPATLKNTIVANSTAGENCTGTITDGGGNLQFGGVADSCGATIPTADPKLSALGDNGGPTQTMALGAGSAALDAANYATCMAAVGSPDYGAGGLDQRGQSRASISLLCDIGAFEGEPPPPILTVTDCSAPSGAAGRLVDVIDAVAAGDTVSFSCSGTITLTTTIIINKDLTIDGAGQSVTISGGNAVRVFTVNSGKTFNLQNLSVTHGSPPGGSGGGINNSGTLNVTNVTFSGNTSTGYGGGIYSDGTLNVTNSTFSGNSGSFGGGIANWSGGTLNVTNSTFSSNSGGWGGGIANWGGPAATTATITNSTFSGNSAGYGGGIYNWNGGTLTVTNSTFSGNSASQGGGIFGSGTLTVTNSTFSGNSSTAGGGGAIESSSLTVKNTIIANSVSSRNCNSALIDGGGNLQFGGTNANSCGATIPTADPRLSALADNGGPTQTMALLPDSPAINAANPANCPTTDQRGVERGSNCDIGAYEYLGIATGTVSSNTGGTIALADGTFTITFPPDAVTTTLTVTFAQVLNPTQPLPTGRIGLRYFTLEARDGGGNLVTNFNQPYTLILSYTDAELAVAGITEETLNVSFWNGTAWVDMLPCGGCGIDAVNNRVTIMANHFTHFALSGQSNAATFTPTATSSATFTPTPTSTATFPPTLTPTATSTATFPPTPTSTATFTPTFTPTTSSTATFTPTFTPTATSTATFTATPTSTATFPPTFTPTATSTATFTPTPTSTATFPPTFTPTTTATSNVAPTVTITNGQCSVKNLASGTINLTLFDADGDPLSLTFVSITNTTLKLNANIVLGGSGNNRTIGVTAKSKKSGTAVLTFNLSDGTVTIPFTITVKVGTDKKDRALDGTAGVDMIFGLNGKDTINGFGGNDLLCGGNGVDTISGGAGNDIIDGQNGNDIVNGGGDNDILRGNLGDDMLTGDAGADFFSGGAGTDTATDFNAGQGDTRDGTIP